MPVSSIKGTESEKRWQDAKKVVDKEYPELKDKDSERYYATVMTIYKSMCKNNSCSPKAESLVQELDMFVEALVKPVEMGNVKERISGINSFLTPFKAFYKETLWPIETGKKQAAKFFLKNNKEVERKFNALMSAYSDLVMTAKETGKYIDVKFDAKTVHGMKGEDIVSEAYMQVLAEAWTDRGTDAWQLMTYDEADKDKTVAEAVTALNAGMKKAVAFVKANTGDELDEEEAGGAIGKAIAKFMNPIYKKYSSVGAGDNAVKAQAMQWMIEFVKKNYGVRGRTDIADYI